MKKQIIVNVDVFNSEIEIQVIGFVDEKNAVKILKDSSDILLKKYENAKQK